MKKYTTIISAQELYKNLDNPDFILIDCRFDLMQPAWGYENYLKEHIPTAVFADLDKDLSGPKTPHNGRHPLPLESQFIKNCSTWGIDDQKQLVVYDTVSGAFAARLWWLLRSYGHEAVAVLNGGFYAWKNAQYPLSQGEESHIPSFFSGHFSNRYMANTKEIESIIGNDSFVMIDARARERYEGKIEPIDPVAGHIPGAKNLFHQFNLTDDGYWKTTEELQKIYSPLVDDYPDDHLIVYCGSGVTSCFNLIGLAQLGIWNARLYLGSWSEWIQNPDHLT
ncbi:MAG: sulfurtransferase [Chloroflexi bacterium HGW-Chloroflexi-10]|nr:MAG: sulfurtransferase [Chloroflexi bacterium HGW-Chloroflexi-10]